ncbi:MAG TPA: HEAT repeat domain-containing protein [Longimicrobium sp.]|nr:HEAT repeat domain-containing protein [Longimicrobium sp.]
MTRIERFARRHPAGVAAMAGLALLALPATLLSRGSRTPVPEPGPVSASLSAAAPAQEGSARAVLAAARGTAPVMCALAVQSAGNGWGMGDDEDAPVLARAGDEVRRALEWMGSRQASAADVAALRDGLGDPDTCVRRMSARLLGRNHVPGGADVLIEALRSGDATRRDAAILGAGYTDDARAVAPLVALLANSDADVRVAAAWALGGIENREATSPLMRLTGDGEPRVRRAAARALGRIEDSAAIPTLAQLLVRDTDPSVRRAAAWALGKIE